MTQDYSTETFLKKSLVFTQQPNTLTIDDEIKSYISDLTTDSFNVLQATEGTPSIKANQRLAVCFLVDLLLVAIMLY